MNILIAGGTGFLGTYIKSKFEENGDKVRVISRAKGDVCWNERDISKELNCTDVLINLAGKSIDCRFAEKNKRQILSSRIHTTALLNNAVSNCKTPPKLWINASAIGIYKHTTEERLNEYSVNNAQDFLGIVVQKWEDVFFSIDFPRTRKVALRTSVVLGASGGVFPLLNRLSKLGLGGKQGDGNQVFSWIFIEDYYRIIRFIIQNEAISGVVNASAPNTISNKQLMKEIKRVNNALFSIPSPKFILRIASYLFNFQPDLVLDSTNIYSQKLQDLNFDFNAPEIKTAIKLLNNKNEK